METAKANPILDPFVHQRTVLLTSFRRVGTPVSTPVSIAVDGDVAYVRSWSTAGKIKRIRNNPVVDVTPSTFRGRPTIGPTLHARARLITGEAAERAKRLLSRKHPILHGLLVPLAHRLLRYETVYLELTAIPER